MLSFITGIISKGIGDDIAETWLMPGLVQMESIFVWENEGAEILS